eukprot:90753_1
MAGACSKLNCNCRTYTKSILTPGLCKGCNHLKDLHNQFFDESLGRGSVGSYDEENHMIKPNHKTLHTDDHFSTKPFKKKKFDILDPNESMWRSKYEQSQKEVEHWQTKYNDLYIKYKQLLSEKQNESLQAIQTPNNQQQSNNSNQTQIDLLTPTDNNDNGTQDKTDSFSHWTTF